MTRFIALLTLFAVAVIALVIMAFYRASAKTQLAYRHVYAIALTMILTTSVTLMYRYYGEADGLRQKYIAEKRLAMVEDFLASVDDPQATVARLQEWVKLNPNSIEGRYLLARVYEKMGNSEKAQQVYVGISEIVASQQKHAIKVQVDLDSKALHGNKAGTLLVYAKAIDGPPMPLAVKKLETFSLPLTLTLSDADAMLPQLRLSQFPNVQLFARISSSGQASPQAGDWLTRAVDVNFAEYRGDVIHLTINTIFQG